MGEKQFMDPGAGYGWSGYFDGVKDNLVFLDGDDGYNGGMPFAVFDADSQKKLFEDSIQLVTRDGFSFTRRADGQLVVKYLRVLVGECSVPKNGMMCWNQFKEKIEMKSAPMPVCKDYPPPDSGTANSVIAYPVEVTFYPKPRIRPVGNPVKCWPED